MVVNFVPMHIRLILLALYIKKNSRRIEIESNHGARRATTLPPPKWHPTMTPPNQSASLTPSNKVSFFRGGVPASIDETPPFCFKMSDSQRGSFEPCPRRRSDGAMERGTLWWNGRAI